MSSDDRLADTDGINSRMMKKLKKAQKGIKCTGCWIWVEWEHMLQS
jgi:hypothetical protein